MVIALVAFLCFWFNFFLFNKLARVSVLFSSLISFLRVLISLLYYPTFFPNSDQSLYYWPEILGQCEISPPFSFYSLAFWLHCGLNISSLQLVNVIYGSFATFCLCICLASFRKHNISYPLLASSPSNRPWSYNIIVLCFCSDPASIIFTSAFGKDLFVYTLVFSLFALIFSASKFALFSLPVFVISSFVCLNDRAYVFIFLSLALVLAFYIRRFSLLMRPPFIQLTIAFLISRNPIRFFISLLGLLAVLSTFVFAYSTVFSTLSFSELFDHYSVDMGGNLAVPDFIPHFIRPFLFLILPLPFITPGIGGMLLGISTLLLLRVICKAHSMKLSSSRSSFLPFAFILSLIIVVVFGSSLSNFGLGVRYRTQYILPSLFSVMLLSDRSVRPADHKALI
ncbi:hypothetical protein [Synechococcus sp. UW140]|uniref:hypothetical protein n=1 Tax=Synechococcus sp. UW140 TaxID=368503 RepID=UPI0031380090